MAIALRRGIVRGSARVTLGQGRTFVFGMIPVEHHVRLWESWDYSCGGSGQSRLYLSTFQKGVDPFCVDRNCKVE